MNRDTFDVSVIWKRPLRPVTVGILAIDAICIPLSLNPQYGAVVQIFALVMMFSWFAVALIISARLRRKNAPMEQSPPD